MTTLDRADLILTGGHVYTGDPADTRAEAVAVRAGQIVAVGTARTIDALRGTATRVIDLRGGMAVPGFGDAHCHPVHGGLTMIQCDLHSDSYYQTLDDYLGIIAAYAAANPDRPWILGGGWSMADFPGGTPRREDLDRVVPDRPVYLPNRDGHSAWVNTRALDLAGVTADTPDPYDGRIERDPAGTPTGSLHDGAMGLVSAIVPPPAEQDLLDSLRAGQRYMHALGLTQWQDAIVEPDREEIAYRSLGDSGELTARVVGALWWERHRGLEQIDELIERRARGPAGRFTPTSVKIMQDGVLETYTGAMLEPYLGADGRPTDNRGPSMVDPALLRDAVTRLEREGFQVHFHAIGDRAVREMPGRRGGRARRERAVGPSPPPLAHPGGPPRRHPSLCCPRHNGQVQALWAVHEGQMDDLTIPFLGPERSGWQYPFASLLRSGARLAMGSDWWFDPQPAARDGTCGDRVAYLSRGAKEPFLPEERISLEAGMAGFTSGTAYVNHMEQETGTIEVGKLDTSSHRPRPVRSGRRSDRRCARAGDVRRGHDDLRTPGLSG